MSLGVLVLVVASGLGAGAMHVVTGPDHLAAVAPLALARRRGAWRVGLGWGSGHALGTFVLALLALGARALLPIDGVSSIAERAVGIVLVALGLWGVRRALRLRVHVHRHAHDGVEHAHAHLHPHDTAHEPRAHAHGHAHRHAALPIGILHGVAGGSHLIGIAPALGMPTVGASVLYLVAFGAGAIVAMAGWALAVGAVAERLAGFGGRALAVLTGASAAASIALGVYWLATA